jgi:hypothetical protein
MANFFKEKINKALSYNDYRRHIEKLFNEGKSTGERQTPGRLNATKLNMQRMARLDKTTVLTPALEQLVTGLKRKYVWLILTEGWCADSAQSLPAINLIAEKSPGIDAYYLLRDENLDLMDKYLTNGGRSVPKLVSLYADTFEDAGTWGPRPAPAQEMKLKYKENPVMPYDEFQKELQLWYTKDKTIILQNEIMEMIRASEG